MKQFSSIKQLLGLFFIVITLASCSSNGKEKNVGGAEQELHEDEHAEGGLELTEQQMKSVDILVGPIEQKNLTAVVKSSGKLAVPPQNEARVNVLTGGIIRQIKVMEGQHVAKGSVLVVIENQELIQLQQDYLSAKNGFSYIDAEFNRQSQLKAANAGTGKAYQLAEANYNAEKSRIKALERQLQQLGISAKQVADGNITSLMPVTAPISGTIGTINIEIGSYVQPGFSLMEMVDNSKIHADLLVYEKDLPKIKIGQKVNFQLTNQNNQQIDGEIYGINKSFANDSKGVIVHAIINSPEANLIPGMYVTALISVGTEKSDAVPIEAVVMAGGKSYIFVVNDEGHGTEEEGVTHFRKVEVSTGVSELGFIQINPLEELPKDSKIVTKGAFYLQSKDAGPSEHGH